MLELINVLIIAWCYLLMTECWCYNMCLLMPSLEKVNCRSQFCVAVTGTNRSAFLSCVLKVMYVYCAVCCVVVIQFNCAVSSSFTAVKPNTGVILHLKTIIRSTQTCSIICSINTGPDKYWMEVDNLPSIMQMSELYVLGIEVCILYSSYETGCLVT